MKHYSMFKTNGQTVALGEQNCIGPVKFYSGASKNYNRLYNSLAQNQIW